MTRRAEWMAAFTQEAMSRDEHVYSKRFLGICRAEVDTMNADPNYEPPSMESVLATAPWGP